MTNSSKTYSPDTLYATHLEKVDQFSFNQQVVNVFPDMINRSVPGYQTIIDGIGKLAALHIKRNAITQATIYDLGCSLGSVSLSVAKHINNKAARIIGIDNSEAMIAQCRQHISAFNFSDSIELYFGDLTEVNISNCDIVVMNFTLQFIDRKKRDSIIQKIFDALKPGGMLILSEKIKHDEGELDQVLVSLHHDFKRENGYSDLEISQKRSALEDVMILDSVSTHQARLVQAGFTSSSLWFQQYNFMSLLAIKGKP